MSGLSSQAGLAKRDVSGLAAQLLVLSVGLLTLLGGVALSPALPGIAAYFQATPNAELGSRLLPAIPGLAAALVAPIAGWVTDHVGRRRALIFAICLCGGAGTSGLWLETLVGLMAAMAMLGAGVAVLTVCAMSLMGDLFVGTARERLIGLYATVTAVGGIGAVFAAGLLAEMSWRYPFGLFVFALPVLALALLIKFGSGPVQSGQGDEIADEDPDHLDLRIVAFVYGLAFADQLAYFMLPSQLPFILEGRGIENAASLTGTLLAWQILCLAFTALLFGKIRDHLSRQTLLALGFSICGLAYSLMLVGNVPALFLLATLSGIGSAFILPTLQSAIISAASMRYRGRVIGGLTAIIAVGQFVSPILLTPVISAFGAAVGFLSAGAALLMIGLGFTWVPRRIWADAPNKPKVS